MGADRLTPADDPGNEEEITEEELQRFTSMQKAARQRKVYRQALFKSACFIGMVLLAMAIKRFQDYFETSFCARIHVDGTDLFVTVEQTTSDDDEGLCLDETEFFVTNSQKYDGPLFMAPQKVVKTVWRDVEADLVVDGVAVKECVDAALDKDLPSPEKAARCRAGNKAEGVVLCHGKQKSPDWAHRPISETYRDGRIKNWLHIDVDYRSDPDVRADLGKERIRLAKSNYKVLFARRCPLEVITESSLVTTDSGIAMDGDGGGAAQGLRDEEMKKQQLFVANLKSWMGGSTVRPPPVTPGEASTTRQIEQEQETILGPALLLLPGEKQADGGVSRAAIHEKPKFIMDNLFWLAWKFGFDVERWVAEQFGSGWVLFKFHVESQRFEVYSDEWWKSKVKEIAAKVRDHGDGGGAIVEKRVEALREEWAWTVDGFGAAVVKVV